MSKADIQFLKWKSEECSNVIKREHSKPKDQREDISEAKNKIEIFKRWINELRGIKEEEKKMITRHCIHCFKDTEMNKVRVRGDLKLECTKCKGIMKS